MTRFQIPDVVIPTFKGLSQLSVDEAEKIGSLLRQFPIGGNFEDLQKIFRKSNFSDLLPDLEEMLFSLGNLLNNLQDKKIDELAEELSEAFAKKEKEKISIADIEQLKNNLLIIFSNADSLKKTFKAIYLLKENMYIYRDGNIITDIRLLFNDELENHPKCGVVLHQLKIDYQENGKIKSFFVSMDKDDLLKLNEILQRALKKEEVVKKNQKDIQLITLK